MPTTPRAGLTVWCFDGTEIFSETGYHGTARKAYTPFRLKIAAPNNFADNNAVVFFYHRADRKF